MTARHTIITRKGQITIPIEIRRALMLNEGDQIEVERHGDVVLMRRATSIAERTSGILADYRKAAPLTAEEERAAFEEAVADEVAASLGV